MDEDGYGNELDMCGDEINEFGIDGCGVLDFRYMGAFCAGSTRWSAVD